ncbi:MAG TPA: SDR family NAD(P)-dependent oxidoreductase, partial [Nitrolancea sp.]|nr:SDR family NAD(P)-dependent oxidoreductase [Nitrolancea sp.]
GKVALVTGGTSGIGEATALRLASEGARVAIAGRDAGRGRALTERIGAEGGEADFFEADVTQEDAVNAMVDAVMARFGRIDVLVNNAGIINHGTVISASVAEWDTLMATNVRGVFLVSRAVLPQMIAGGGGSVINLGSNLGLVGTRGAAAYVTSKGAIVQLSKAMALDHVADGIRVNCVCPGTIDTPLVQRQRVGRTEEQLRQSDERLRERHPIGRMGTPDEVAGVIAFLASDEASFVTGSLYSVDGGYIAQ